MSVSLLHFCACEGGIEVFSVAMVLHGGVEVVSIGTAEARATKGCKSGDSKTGWQYHSGVSVLALSCFSFAKQYCWWLPVASLVLVPARKQSEAT
jgi:hypothetical protein